MPRGVWIIVIVIIPLVGGVLWLLFGNENAYLASTVQGFKKASGSARPTNPDDDEEFLRQLDSQRAQERKARELREREAGRRRRGESPRRRTESDSQADAEPE